MNTEDSDEFLPRTKILRGRCAAPPEIRHNPPEAHARPTSPWELGTPPSRQNSRRTAPPAHGCIPPSIKQRKEKRPARRRTGLKRKQDKCGRTTYRVPPRNEPTVASRRPAEDEAPSLGATPPEDEPAGKPSARYSSRRRTPPARGCAPLTGRTLKMKETCAGKDRVATKVEERAGRHMT